MIIPEMAVGDRTAVVANEKLDAQQNNTAHLGRLGRDISFVTTWIMPVRQE